MAWIQNTDFALARAMVLGQARGVSEADFFLFGISGLAHILSASGFHLLVAAACARGLARMLFGGGRSGARARPELEAILVLGVATAFTVVSGNASPTVRALAALTIVIGSLLAGRSLRTGPAFFASALAAWIWGGSGWLSLTLSLLAAAGISWAISLRRPPAFRFAALLSAPWLATLPLTTAIFHSVPLLSPIFNLLLSPGLAFAALVPGMLALSAELTNWSSASQALWTIAAGAVAITRLILEHCARGFPFALWVPENHWLYSWGGAALLALSIRSSRLRIVGLIVFVAIFRISQSYFPSPLRAHILDAGQGDSILLEAHDSLFLVDTGLTARGPYPPRAALSLAALAPSTLAGILITHPDADHAGGLSSVLLRHALASDASVWISQAQLSFRSARALLRAAERFAAPISFLDDNRRPIPGLECRVATNVRDSNDASPLCKFDLGGAGNLLLTGDMDTAHESVFLRADPEFLRARFLKVAHHGSRSSSGANFLAGVGAETAFISVGEKNRYGHPSSEAMSRLRQAQTDIRRTDEEGSITVP